jgi:hypothetical protein
MKAAAELELRRRRRQREIPNNLILLDKNVQPALYRPNAVQRELLDTLTGRDLVLKARQLGVSTAIQADMFIAAVTRTVLCATLSHDDESTQKLRRMADRFWSELPLELRPRRGIANATTTTYPDTRSEVTIITAGSPNKGRGGTYTYVHGSEVAFWKDAQALMSGVLQGVPAHGRIVLESTPNGAQGWFYERCMEALDGDTRWKLHFFPWWHDEGYRIPGAQVERLTNEEEFLKSEYDLSDEQIAWRRQKQRELGPLFVQEYPEDPRSCFITSGAGFFGPLHDVFAASESTEPRPGMRYVAGLDWGQAQDYTALSIVEVETGQQVELLVINRLPYAEIRARVASACRRWRVQRLVVELNSIGQPNFEALRDELDADVPELEGFTTTSSSKQQVLSALRLALEDGALKLLPDPHQIRQMRAYTAQQTRTGHWQYSAPAGEHDDIVIANALAWRAVQRIGVRHYIDTW